MDISQMRIVLVLAESGSMTAAAKKLHVTQPALTYQIKTIESKLGFKVFDRSRSGTALTSEGAFLCDSMRDIIARYDEMMRLGHAMAKEASTSTIRVGINAYSRDAVTYLLRNTASDASFSFIHCGTSDPVKLLRDHVIDFWSASDAALDDMPASLRFLPLSPSGQSAFVHPTHPLAKRTTIEMGDLVHETVSLWPHGSASRSADLMRSMLESSQTDIRDFPASPIGAITTTAAEGVVVYDDGFLPPPDHVATKVPITDAPDDTLGLVYLASRERQLAPVMADLEESVSNITAHSVSASELSVERILAAIGEIGSAVKRGSAEEIAPLVEYGLQLGISAHHLLNRGLLASMREMEEEYRKGAIDTEEMVATVATTNKAMDMLHSHLAEEDERGQAGVAVIGTVLGDEHDLGKKLVRIMLESRNIEVCDLGTQVRPNQFVRHLQDNPSCNLVLVSATNTAVLDNVRGIVEALDEAGLREQVFLMVGGLAIDQAFADEIGADAYTENAEDAAQKAYELLQL